MIKDKTLQILVLGGLITMDLMLFLITEPSLKFLNGGIFREFEETLIQPVFFGSFFLILTIAIFLFYPSAYFKNWLKYIASWYIPLSIIFVSQIKIYSSFILAIDRSRAALWWMGGLLLITLAYVLIHKYILRIK